MIFSIYMKLTQNGVPVINGDVAASGYENWIELNSVQFGPSNRDPRMNQLTEGVITKIVDAASSSLARAAVTGAASTGPIKAEIDFVENGSGTVYQTITLENVIISNYSTGGRNSNSGRPTEKVALNFTQIVFDFPAPRDPLIPRPPPATTTPPPRHLKEKR